MKNKKIKNNTVIVITAIVLLLLSTSPLWTAILIKRQALLVVEDSLHNLIASTLANINVSDGFLEMTVALSTSDQKVRNENLIRITELMNKTSLILHTYGKTIKDPEERRNYEKLLQKRSIFNLTRQKAIDLLVQEKHEEAIQVFNQEVLKEFHEYKDAVNRIVHDNVNEAGRRGRQILQLCNFLMIFQGVILVFFSIYAFVVPMLTVLDKVVTKDVVKDI
jgi:hypothetical protein